MKLMEPVGAEGLGGLIQALDGAHGLDISCYDESFLLKSIGKRLLATGIGTVAGYGAHLAGDCLAETMRQFLGKANG